MGLFPIVGADPDELDEAEEKADEYQQRYYDARKDERSERRRADAKNAALEHTIDGLSPVADKSNLVETISQPAVAYKSVDKGIATLLIPEGATVVHPTAPTSKRRTDKAVVLKIEDMQSGKQGISRRNALGAGYTGDESLEGSSPTASYSVSYEVGETVRPEDGGNVYDPSHESVLNTNTSRECAGGIHFFRTKKEAEDWHKNWV